jgi:hypothetical protein
MLIVQSHVHVAGDVLSFNHAFMWQEISILLSHVHVTGDANHSITRSGGRRC